MVVSDLPVRIRGGPRPDFIILGVVLIDEPVDFAVRDGGDDCALYDTVFNRRNGPFEISIPPAAHTRQLNKRNCMNHHGIPRKGTEKTHKMKFREVPWIVPW